MAKVLSSVHTVRDNRHVSPTPALTGVHCLISGHCFPKRLLPLAITSSIPMIDGINYREESDK